MAFVSKLRRSRVMNEMVQSESERPRTTRLGAVVRHLSAALVAMLLIPVTGVALLQIQVLSASAAVTNGSMEISSGGQQQINLGAGFNPNTGATFEAWVNFSTIAASNRIFRAWTGTTATRAFELTWSNTGLMSWYSAVSQTTCTIQTKAPVVGTWYNLALAVENYSQSWTANTSSVFLNGNLLRICRDARNPSTGNIQGVQLGGSAGQAMKMSAVRISSTTRYSTQSYSHTQTTTYPTTTDSTVWALYNAVYDDSDANSCFTNSDPGTKSATLTTVTGSVSCSSSSPASRTTAVDGSISLPSGATAALGRFGGANTSRFDGSNRHMPDEGWTWEGWVKFSTIAAGWNTIFVACSNGPAGSTIIEGGCSGFGNPIQLLWNSTNGQASYTGCSNVSTGVVPVTNEWYHLAVSTAAIGGTVNNYLFINGERKGTCTVNSGAYNGGVEGFRIGGTTGTTMKIGPTRYRGLQRYISNFTPARTYETGGTFFVLNTKYDNYDLCLRNEDAANRMSPYGTMSGGTATCSTDIPPPLPPAFSYSTSPVSVSSGSAFTAMTPTQAGSQVDSYSISPALSNGLTLNPTTGVISGTPIYSPVTSYVVTGTQNSSGLTATANVSITVNKLASSVSIALANSVAQVGVTNTITATASQPGNVSFQTDLGVIPGCSSVATTTVSPFRATCDWDPVSIYYTMNATLTPTSNEYAVSTSSPSLTNLRGSLTLTSTGQTRYPGEQQGLGTNNTLRLNFPTGTGLITAQSFTIETWIKVDSPSPNVDINAVYGYSFYGDRGQGISITGTSTASFLSASYGGNQSFSPAIAQNVWQNLVFQRTYVPNRPSQSFDAVFLNGVLINQFGNGGLMHNYSPTSTDKSTGVRIGPFNGVAQIGPTQVLSGVAAYPLTGFSPSTTYSYGANTLALFQPSPTTCGSAAISPSSVTAGISSTNACSSQFPVALPRVESVVANSGPQAGGNAVTISGKNFVNLTGVKFGSTTVAGTNYTVNSFGTEINVTNVPPGTNTVDVTVVTAAGTSSITAGSSYTYLPAPTISGLDRTTGSTLGGNAVVITGTNFTSASAVTFGSTNASYFNVNSETQITAVSPPGVSGVVDIRVTTPGGTSAIVSADRFTYTSSVSIIGISPSTGSTLGGTAVVISGTNFTDASAVVFGSTNATSFTVDSASSITAVAPAGTAGVVDIRVTAPGGTSESVAASQFTYTSSVTVTGITPSTGSAAGGASVVISGTNFTGATAVVFGSTNATSFTVDRSSQITAVAPAGTAGLVNVRVTAPGGTSAIVAAGQFTYFPVPTISSLGTTVGLTTGGTSVVITGTNFTNVNSVTFGSSSASSFTVNSATQITAVSPSGTAGVVDVRVTTLGGTTAIVSAGQFTYFGLPTIDTVSPSSGPTAGSTSVVITGTNFTGATAVTFGTTNATSFTVDSPTQITAVSPARPAGTVDIKVTNPGGTSAVSLYGIYGQFSYLSPPSISSISPSTGSITGGASVTITGTDLSNLLTNGGVMFGSLPAQSVVQIDPTSIVAVAPATTALGPVHITLTNASGTSAQTSASEFTYTRSDDATLSGLSISTGVLSPTFASGTTAYSISNARDGMTVTPTVNTTGAVVDVKVGSGSFVSVTSGSPSLPLSLVVGSNTITVRVTADDGTTTRNYTITATRLSSVATLSVASIKGVTASLGTASETIGSETAGSVTLTTAQATGSAVSSFTKTDSGATVTKIVKFSSGTVVDSTSFSAAEAFTSGATTPMVDGDFFVIEVTAADGTVNYSRINVVVNSNIATLSAASVKGLTATLGVPSETIGSATAGSVTLTTAQGIGSAITSFTTTHGGATITKIVKFSSGSTVSLLTFASAPAFSNGATTQVVDGDFLIVQVTAADGTVNYTRINLVVNSNIATLSAASIKGVTASVGTAGATIGSETAGSVTLTTAQGIGSASTSFTRAHGGATITKIAKFPSGAIVDSTSFSAAEAFTSGATTPMVDGDFFVVQVTAADGTVNFTRINVVVNSNIATLSAASIKGVTASVGTAGATIGSETAGSVTLTTAQSTSSAVTSFVKTHVGATVSKIVKFPSGAIVDSASFLAAEAFTSGATTPMVDGDFFVVHVTAADGTVNFTRINVVVNSNIATLSAASIKGVTASVGTAGATIGSETAGSVTLTTAQSMGSAVSTFTRTDNGAVVTKIAKFSSGTVVDSTNFLAAEAFTSGATTPMADGDFFVVQVTAADGTVNFSRINVVVNSNIATLSAASIKGVTASLGTANATFGSETAGSATLTTAQGVGSAVTSFTTTHGGATITKIVKFSSGSTANVVTFTSEAAFSSGATTPMVNGDFFVVQVTAADGTVNFTRINLVVNSNIATLSSASVKGLATTLGTASPTIGSATPGSVMLTAAQGSGTAVTSFTTTHGGATITKIVKFSSGSTANTANFLAAQAFTNGATTQVADGDFFVIEVTAADGTVIYTRINVVFSANPSAPRNFSASGRQGGADLTWSAPVTDGGSAITGYFVQRSTDSTNWTDVGTTNAGTTSYSVTGLSNGTSFVYRVRAMNDSGSLIYNFATSGATVTDYLVSCSGGGSFHVRGSVIPSAAGKDCSGTATIPQGIVEVAINSFAPGSAATQTNRALTALVFPPGFKHIGQGGFRNLGLTSLTIPASVTMVGLAAFENNPLTSVTITGASGAESTFLSQGSFTNQGVQFNLNTSIALTFGSGKIEIGHNFGRSTTFSTVDFGSGLTSIAESAFKQNGIAPGWVPVFPSTIKTIEQNAFTYNPNMKTIRFGSSTTSSITSISDIAFDTTLEDVQYCGPSGTVLSNYLARRLSSALIWCSTEVPNAPIDLTAAPSNGQVALTWTRGALRDEAPTSDYLIQYSSNSGQTWTTFTRSASKLTSATVTGLSNGTNYTFRVAAVNLFGNSTYSSTATAKPLGQSFTPIFGPSTATSNGFTVNVTNFDSSFVYDSGTVTSGSGSVFIGSPAGGLLPITVTGMSAGATSTISIRSSKEGVSDGIGYASGSALQAALIPTVDNIVRATGGFTARIANYDANFTWNASATPGNVLVSPTGSISVTGVSPSTQVVLELSTSRTGFVAGTSSTTVTTLQLLQVLYDGNGATGGSAPTDSQQYGSSEVVTVLGNPSQGGLSRSGSVFVGWTINPNGTGVVYQSGTTLQLASTTVTLYAKWSLIPYSVTYKPNGATGGSVPIDLSSYTIGQSAPVFGNTGNLVRPGYSFIGWGYNSTATDVLYQSGDSYTVGTSNISFWARWTADTYTVTYDSNGATGSPSKASDSYTTASTPISLATAGSLAKVGHNFVGWGVSAVSAPVSDSYTVTEDTRLYAQWRASNYSVTYVAGVNGTGTPPTQANVNFASSFSVASPSGLTSNDGQNEYAFVSWSDGTKTYSPGQNYLMGAQPVVLTAQWTRIYNVRYSFNGGSVATPIADQQKISGDVITITAVIPSRGGYEFLNWKDQSGRVASAGDSYSVSDNNYLLYAQWRAISYSVSYDVNGGDTEPQEPNHVIGDTFNVAAAPTKAGHDFSHWSDGTNQYNAGTTYLVGTSHVNLQAIWTPQVYRISFDFNGGVGSPIAPIDYTFNTPAATLPMTGISRPDYSFRGWSTSASATNGSSTFTPSGDVLLRAVWVSSVYRLTFDAVNGYADRASDKVTIGQSTTLPSATRANHTLLGWSTQQSGGTTLNAGDTYVPTADATLYARWALQVFTITYDGNGGTATENSASMTFGSTTPIVLPNAGRLNYVFNGWYSAARGGYLLGVAGASFAPTTSLTAYAQWIQGSLAGMGPATQIAQATVQAGYDLSFTAGSNGSTATVSYKADSLPDGTVITAFVENSTTRVTPLLATRAEPILTLILSWVAPDGSVPNTATGKPIVMTITNSNITAGSKVFGLIGDVPVYLGTSVEDGQVQVSISEDPAVIVAMVTPDAPTAVTASEVNETSARISWTAPASNGGSPITRFTATSSSGLSCNSVSTSCVITGLTAGASYSFTVKATNAIGDGSLSVASQTLRLTAAVAQPTTTVPTTTVPTSTVPTSTVPNGGAVPAGSGNVPSKEALEIAGEVLESVEESATENAQDALESLTDQDESGAKPNSPDDKEAQESASEGNGDSPINAFWLLLLLVLVLVGSFVAIRRFVKRK
jgi:hypothetical protein